METKNKQHNAKIQRYRSKLKFENRKRIEAWIDQPICLEVLKKQSGLNQTQVINQLLEIVSDGISQEFFKNEVEMELNAERMKEHLQALFSR